MQYDGILWRGAKSSAIKSACGTGALGARGADDWSGHDKHRCSATSDMGAAFMPTHPIDIYYHTYRWRYHYKILPDTLNIYRYNPKSTNYGVFMKVFMSWSGQRSKLTAELLHGWVKCVIQAAQPWISSKGIERGALWFSEINNELKDTTVGVICLTQENKNAPWILFEAGALAKGLTTNRVCTFLVDLIPSDLQSPLAQFNHTVPNKESMWSLVTTLNNGLEANRLELPVLQRVFDTYWPQFEADFENILKNNPPTTVVAPRDEKDMLAEILDTTRSMSNRIRMLEDTKISKEPMESMIRESVGMRNTVRSRFEQRHQIDHAVELTTERLARGIDTNGAIERLMAEFAFPHQVATNIVNKALSIRETGTGVS
jgi:hypothetical protein